MSEPKQPPQDVELATLYMQRAVEHYGHATTVKATADGVQRIIEYPMNINGQERTVRLTVSIVE